MRSSYLILLRGWRSQARIIHALIIRNIVVRHGRTNLGFVWVFLEPMILTAGVLTLWSSIGGSERQGLNVVEFLFTGYMPLTLWRHISTSTLNLFRASV